MLNRRRMIRAMFGREVRWRELLFWTLLLGAFQSLESAEYRRQVMGIAETAAFLFVAISSASKLDGLGLEFTSWNRIGFRAAAASVAAGIAAGGAVVIVALRCHQPLGTESRWNHVILAVILGPVVEELVFRGYLMTAALRLAQRFSMTGQNWPAVIAVALIFMFAHRARSGTTGTQLFCMAATGTVYGFIRLRQHSTVAAVLAHGCYNLALYLSFWIGVSN